MSIYVAGLCVEDARVTDGKLLHHCVGCPAFGRCLFDIRSVTTHLPRDLFTFPAV